MALTAKQIEFYSRPSKFVQGAFVDRFGMWLLSEEYAEYRRACHASDDVDAPESLFDVLEVWLCLGDAIETCGSYPAYLRTVFDVVDLWVRGDATYVDGVGLWPLDNDSRGACKQFSSLIWSGDSDMRAAMMHPAVNPAVWDAVVAGRRNAVAPQ